jgi:YHS domain-containing protein
MAERLAGSIAGRLRGERAADVARCSQEEVLEMTKDPVCGMTVDDQTPHRTAHAGQTFLFCSESCKKKFEAEPERYAPRAEAAGHQGIRS